MSAQDRIEGPLMMPVGARVVSVHDDNPARAIGTIVGRRPADQTYLIRWDYDPQGKCLWRAGHNEVEHIGRTYTEAPEAATSGHVCWCPDRSDAHLCLRAPGHAGAHLHADATDTEAPEVEPTPRPLTFDERAELLALVHVIEDARVELGHRFGSMSATQRLATWERRDAAVENLMQWIENR